MFERLIPIITEEKLELIRTKKILLVGIGGVGGFTLEALVRSGFENITIVDGDKIELSNLNRQIISSYHNIGKQKIEEAKNRVLSINPNINMKAMTTFLTKDNFDCVITDDYDYIIDAIDDIPMKVELIRYANEKNIKIISSLGTGRKLNPRMLEIVSLNQTYNDPLAKKLRQELRKENIDLNIPVIFSREEAIKTENMVGSAIFVPSVAGILLANYVFMDIINEEKRL